MKWLYRIYDNSHHTPHTTHHTYILTKSGTNHSGTPPTDISAHTLLFFFSQSILVSRRSRHIRLSFERIIFSLEPENFNSIRVCCYHSMAFGFEKGNGNGRK
ncbi:hypothetical protein HBH56_015310 [Parastagonospora nodorum]|uniref:Uncharacterized protein n=1 Tax=Phaeosphaeria nodorum (strain SN15 / ATCC MYA-4574 / FGSC 10173) TaxID=321614 RepID=A0A7U2HYG4_PHANO|nr:hypothetical protein HBH56_015310 [Parastagonospora nodorum]QRC95009.1 hypothetical protein JI435_301900 [Parastagonospora nodorum SN15]KAH3937238.1 hypothetical protein HBH54_019130 [Parastagonospora nodorum]KAH4025386.1 hypothetical protein HBI09_152830 [Parastagonospora nodorum]KAH4120984.1 hypothetical protein HBH47_106160 [Parastagonospora nodorum]